MKFLKLLQILINVFFIILLLSILGWIVIISYQMIRGLNTFSFKMQIYTFLNVLLLTVFSLGVFWLKKTVVKLADKDFYAPSVARNFKRAGMVFISTAIFSALLDFSSEISMNAHYDFTFNPDISSTFFSVIIGLFFIFFSEVLRKGKILKDENDLTV